MPRGSRRAWCTRTSNPTHGNLHGAPRLRGPVVTLRDDPTVAEFETLLQEHEAVVVDFYATWCGPCKTYSPRFAQAARDARRRWPEASVAFLKIDIDRARELAGRYNIKSVPTTLVLRRKKGLLGGVKMAPAERLMGNIAQGDLLGLIERVTAGG
jgi:thioredoxin-like negative regulator of GroEL